MAETNSTTIAENATQPASVTVDGQTVTQHNLKDQIEADKYARRTAVSSNPRLALGKIIFKNKGTT